MNAKLRKKGLLYRCLDVNTPEGSFTVEYNGRGIGHQTVLVDGKVVACPQSKTWFFPRFSFQIGSFDAALLVRVWPWLAIRSFFLIVNAETIYTEIQVPTLVPSFLLKIGVDVRQSGAQLIFPAITVSGIQGESLSPITG